jgi:N,N-dimethylformamidase beta subunit-like protein
MNDKKFSFIATGTTLIMSILIAGAVTLSQSYSGNIGQGIKTSIQQPEKGILLVPFRNTYESMTTQESNTLQATPSLRSSVQAIQTAPQPYVPITRTNHPSVVIRTQRSNITIFPQLNENETHHIFSTNTKARTLTYNRILNGRNPTNRVSLRNTSSITTQIKTPERIAYVAPTFTIAAYNNRFYIFYKLEENVPHDTNVTKHLNLLTSRVIKLPPQQIKHVFLGVTSNLQVITDEDVDNSSIFIHKSNNNASSQSSSSSSINKFDVLILGHQEYVTQKEYDNLKHFVENGGTLILLDGNVFYAQVSYDRDHHTITLVKGHGWAFNGITAWKSVSERWANETSKWVGGNFLPCVCPVTFANDPFEYKHHEEQYITNRNDTILINYDAKLVAKQHVSYKPVIATYELHYKKGQVIVLGLYSDDILDNLKFDKYFDTLLMQHAFKQHVIGYQR